MNVHRLFVTISVHHAVKIFVSQTYLFYKNDSHTQKLLKMSSDVIVGKQKLKIDVTDAKFRESNIHLL